jgi:hypothetical protein
MPSFSLSTWAKGVALAVIEGAGNDRHIAVRLEADAAHLFVRRGGDLQIAADADAAQLAALLRLALARLEAVPVGKLDRAIEHLGELAAVVFHA